MSDGGSPVRTVAVLGAGTMGAPMARRLVTAGFDVRVWNRTPERAAGIDGVEVHAVPADAARGADVVLTMLSDGGVVESVIRAALPQGRSRSRPLWLQMSTVGVADTRRLAGVADELGVAFVDAPVLGSREPAQRGELVILASGEDAEVAACAPLLHAVGSRTLQLGPAGRGTNLKVVINAWIMAGVAVLADTIALAEELGVRFTDFLDATDRGAIGALYTEQLGETMTTRGFEHRFGLALALKDASLAVDGERASPGRMFHASREQFAAAVDLGFGDHDITRVLEAALGTTTTRGIA